MRIILFLCLANLFFSCESNPFRRFDVRKVETYSPDHTLQMVIEIPAGTNHKFEYDKEKNKLIIDKENGKDRVIDFLGYPGNYGYIPGTLMDKDSGGDGDALDVLLISEALPALTVLEVIPIGALLLVDGEEMDTKIIAVPKDPSLQTMSAVDFNTFLIEYDAAKRIIEEWFLHYKGGRKTSSLGWRNAAYCQSLIERCKINK